MTTKVQPAVSTFQPRSLTKQHPAVELNAVSLCNQICQYRSQNQAQIRSTVAFLSSTQKCTPSKALPFFTHRRLNRVGFLFLCILGKKAVPESESEKEVDYGIQLLGKSDWNSSDRCVFESARVECFQIMQSIISSSFSNQEQSRITKQLTRRLPSRSVKHLTGSKAKTQVLHPVVLARIFMFEEPRAFIEIIPKVSKLWQETSALPIVLEIQMQHCKMEVELLAVLVKNLKEESLTLSKMQELFAMSPFHSCQYRFEYWMREEVPKLGKLYPDFFVALKSKTAPCENVANINQIIWSVAEEYPLAKAALIQGAADAFEKEMRAPIGSLLPKDKGGL